MNDLNEIAGNDQAQDTTTVDSGEPRINAGAIRKSTTQSILKAASAASGMEFDSVEAMAAAFARLSAQQSMAPVQPQSKETVQPKRTTNTDLHEQFQSLKQELSQKEQALRERELDGEIRGAMGDRFDSDLIDYALTKVRSNVQWEDGSYQIVNSKGQIRYGDDGNPLTIKGLVDEVAKGNPKLLRMAQGSTSGSGLRAQSGQFGGEAEAMPDYSQDPAAFNAWANRNGLGRGAGLKGVGAKVSTSTTSRRVV
jgi:hypothetical protein